ncbi:hypothetical protein AMTRI_Chr09g42550 [Amborella trichopoda]
MSKKHMEPFDRLPDEMIAHIMVDSVSFDDLNALKNMCKRFKVLSEDASVMQRISRELVAESLWQPNSKPMAYLKRCAHAGNAEAQYLLGMRDPGSMYAMGLILIGEGKYSEGRQLMERIDRKCENSKCQSPRMMGWDQVKNYSRCCCTKCKWIWELKEFCF